MDIEDKRKPMIGVTLKSSVDLAEVAYETGWRSAIAAAVTMMAKADDSFSVVQMMLALQAMPIEPSAAIEKMKAALK